MPPAREGEVLPPEAPLAKRTPSESSGTRPSEQTIDMARNPQGIWERRLGTPEGETSGVPGRRPGPTPGDQSLPRLPAFIEPREPLGPSRRQLPPGRASAPPEPQPSKVELEPIGPGVFRRRHVAGEQPISASPTRPSLVPHSESKAELAKVSAPGSEGKAEPSAKIETGVAKPTEPPTPDSLLTQVAGARLENTLSVSEQHPVSLAEPGIKSGSRPSRTEVFADPQITDPQMEKMTYPGSSVLKPVKVSGSQSSEAAAGATKTEPANVSAPSSWEKAEATLQSQQEATAPSVKQSKREPIPKERVKAGRKRTQEESSIETSRLDVSELEESGRLLKEQLEQKLANTKPRPPDLDRKFADLPLGDPEARLEALKLLRDEPNLSPESVEYLKWQEEILGLREQVQDISGGQAKLGNKLEIHEALLSRARAALRDASKTVKTRLRKVGPEYRRRSEVKFDQIMGEESFKTLSKEGGPRPALQTDHLVSLDEIANSPVMTDFLAVLVVSRPNIQQEMLSRLESFGDIPENLVRMRADANNKKSSRSWNDIVYDEMSEFGYSNKNIEDIRARENRVRETIMRLIDDVTNEFRR